MAATDAGHDAGPIAEDAGAGEDAGGGTDGGPVLPDAGPPVDAGEPVVGFDVIQLDLENEGGGRGAYRSCTSEAASCHQNPARNVWIIPNPTAAELRENWQRILETPAGVTPWVTPADETAQMLVEVPVTDEVRARWLRWIQAGAPFEAP